MNENEFELPFNSDRWKFETPCLASTMLVERELVTIWKESQVIHPTELVQKNDAMTTIT